MYKYVQKCFQNFEWCWNQRLRTVAHQAGQLAQRRLARGLRLNHPEVRLWLRIQFLVFQVDVFTIIYIAKLLEIQNLVLSLSLLVFPCSHKTCMKFTWIWWDSCFTRPCWSMFLHTLRPLHCWPVRWWSGCLRFVARFFGNLNARSTCIHHKSMCCKCWTVRRSCFNSDPQRSSSWFLKKERNCAHDIFVLSSLGFLTCWGSSEMANLLQHWWTWESNCLAADRCLPVPE